MSPILSHVRLRVRTLPLYALTLLVPAAGAQRAARLDTVATHVAPSASASTPRIREQTADQQVMQVLNRLAFGPRPGDVARVRAMGVDAWIAQQLHPEQIQDTVMDRLIATSYPMVNADQSQLAKQYAVAVRARRMAKRRPGDSTAVLPPAKDPAFRQIARERMQLVTQLESERVARAVASNRQLLEVMTDFWENHFSVYLRKNAIEPYLLADYDRTIRAHALGKFRDLLGAVAHSPAMLIYLDNAESRANPGEPTLAPDGRDPVALQRLLANPNLPAQRRAQIQQFLARQKTAGLNENYGRELMELHTIGVNGGYTQADVIAAARALTGWSVRPPAQGGGFIFRPQWHDAGPKVFLGHTLPAGRGEEDGEQVLDILASSPAAAHFISRELCQRFVSDSPSTALVNRAAETFLRTGGDIREVVRTIVTSPEFFSSQAYRAKVKSPFETVVSAARALGAAPDTTPRTALAVAYLGEPIFGHQDPNGWPETGESWMNTGAILNRINFGLAAAADRLPGMGIETFPGADTLMNAPRNEQVDAAVAALLGGAASPDTRTILESGDHPFLTDARTQASRDTRADSAGATAPDMAAGAQRNGTRLAARALLGRPGKRGGNVNVLGQTPDLTGLAQVVGLALGSPEFQRR